MADDETEWHLNDFEMARLDIVYGTVKRNMFAHSVRKLSSNKSRNSSACRLSNTNDGRSRIEWVPHPPRSSPFSIAAENIVLKIGLKETVEVKTDENRFSYLLCTIPSRWAIVWWSHATRVPLPRTFMIFPVWSAIF